MGEQIFGDEDGPGRRITDHEAESILRVVRIQGDVGTTCFQDADEARHQAERTAAADADEFVRLYAMVCQGDGDPIGLTVETIVGPFAGIDPHSGCVRRLCHLFFEQLMDRRLARVVCPGLVPLMHNLLVLFIRRQGNRGDGMIGLVGQTVQQGLKVCDHSAHGLRTIEIRGVFPGPGDSVGPFLEFEGRVESGRRLADVSADDIDVAHVQQPQGLAAQHQHGLEHGAVAGIAVCLQVGDQLFERNVLVFQPASDSLAGLFEELREGRGRCQVQVECDRVREQADEGFQLLSGAIAHRCTKHDLRLAGVFRQQNRIGRQQGDEEGRITLAGDLAQGLDGLGTYREAFDGTTIGLRRRA